MRFTGKVKNSKIKFDDETRRKEYLKELEGLDIVEVIGLPIKQRYERRKNGRN